MADELPEFSALQWFGAMIGFAIMFIASVFLLQIIPIRLFIAGIVFGAIGTLVSIVMLIVTLVQGATARSPKPSGDGASAMASLFNNMSEQGAANFANMLNNATPTDVKNLADRLNMASETDVQKMAQDLNTQSDPSTADASVTTRDSESVTRIRESGGTAQSDQLIRFSCPTCGKRVQAKTHLAGKQLHCPNKACGQILSVPELNGE